MKASGKARNDFRLHGRTPSTEPLDSAPTLDKKMQESRFVITASYFVLGGLAYTIGAVDGNILKVLCAIGIMPLASLLSIGWMHEMPALQARITAVNLVLDTLLTSWVVFWTGGTLSPCLPFYLTTVMAASFRFGPRGSLLYTLLAVACLCMVGTLDPHRLNTLHGMAGMALRIAILFAAAGFGIRALHQKLGRYQKEKTLNRELEQANRDLTAAYEDLQATQDQLLHAEKLASIGRLVAGVAHEINNPISFIYGNLIHLQTYVQRLKTLLRFDDNLPLPSPFHENREEAKRAIDYEYLLEDLEGALGSSRNGAERIQRIVEALLDFSRVRKATFQDVDLQEPLENALCILASKLKGDVEVKREHAGASTVRGDPNELGQLFLNLLTNALDAVEGGGTIRVRTFGRRDGDDLGRVVVEVEDDGPGIPPEDRDRIFEPFFTTKDVGKGTGLGLSIAYSIAKRHKGELSALAASPRGTLFRVSLPASPPPTRCTPEASSFANATGGCILQINALGCPETLNVNIDLHIHSTASDGSLTPKQIVREAREAGLNVISIADHDTTSGLAEALVAQDAHGVIVVPGVEISASHPSGEAHILGYWMDYDDPDFQAFLERPRSTRGPRIVEMCKCLRGLGLDVQAEEVFEEAGGKEAVGRPHLAKVLLAKGYVKDVEEAFRGYLAKGAPAYVKRIKNTTAETIAAIHRWGGISVIAHPGLLKDPGLVYSLIQEGAMGIEVLCHEHDSAAVERYSETADRHGLLKTGGSDYHGDMLEKTFRLGDLQVPYPFYLELKEAKARTQSPTRDR